MRDKLQKQTTKLQNPISLEEKVAITLRFLATGKSYKSLIFQYCASDSTISTFIPVVCCAITDLIRDEVMAFPATEDDWVELAKEYEDKWQFPNCFRAMNGKHIALFNPHYGGSTYFNYKGFYSIVLLALVDADYKFMYVDIGCQGHISDGGVFRNCHLYKELSFGQMKIP